MQISCAVSNVPIINCNLEKTDSKGTRYRQSYQRYMLERKLADQVSWKEFKLTLKTHYRPMRMERGTRETQREESEPEMSYIAS